MRSNDVKRVALLSDGMNGMDGATRKALEAVDAGAVSEGGSRLRDAFDRLAVDALGALCLETVQKANSGHPGGPLSSLDMAYVLHADFLDWSGDPTWADRDRFILSGGHMSSLLYAMLHLQGRLSLDDLKNFRQLGSPTQGHPVYRMAPGIENSSGPLGQGFANAVGFALAEKLEGNRFGKATVDHWTYCLTTDGDLQEGISREAAALAGRWGLGRLVMLYDSNQIQLATPTAEVWNESVADAFRAMHWQVLEVDGHDHAAIRGAIELARSDEEHPSLIIGHTRIAHGTTKEGQVSTHGSPVGQEVIDAFKAGREHPKEAFWLPELLGETFAALSAAGDARQKAWQGRVDEARSDEAWRRDWDDLRSTDRRTRVEELFDEALADYDGKAKLATRAASGKVLQALAERCTFLVGGSADLGSSTKTDGFEKAIGCLHEGLEAGSSRGRALRFGVREHAMASICNGLAYHGGWVPFCGTFLVFSDYLRPAMRLAALSKLPVQYVLTHDSIFLGEDGETHQPVEHLAALRTMPRVVVMRPADARETAEAWRWALLEATADEPRPVVHALSRQSLPPLPVSDDVVRRGVAEGAYVVRDVKDARGTLLATGSEVSACLEAAEALDKEGMALRVVSMPAMELFADLDCERQEEILRRFDGPVLAVEAACAFGWHRWADDVISIEGFGQSAPAEELAEHYGFSKGRLVARIEEILSDYDLSSEL